MYIGKIQFNRDPPLLAIMDYYSIGSDPEGVVMKRARWFMLAIVILALGFVQPEYLSAAAMQKKGDKEEGGKKQDPSVLSRN